MLVAGDFALFHFHQNSHLAQMVSGGQAKKRRKIMTIHKLWEGTPEVRREIGWSLLGGFIGYLLCGVGGVYFLNYYFNVPTAHPCIAVLAGVLHLVCGAPVAWRSHMADRWLTAHGIVFFFPAHQPAYWNQAQQQEREGG